MAFDHETGARMRSDQGSAGRKVTIGLLNNMGDEALKTTERQFRDLILASAADVDVELRLFAFSQTPRSPRALDYLSERYEPASAAIDGDLDALIVTGAQPRRTCLSDEAYWEELTDLIDLARERTVSTIFSCLAAHAAVLHLDAVERRPYPEKCTGVFVFATERSHPYAAWQRRVVRLPHSRCNGLSRTELERAGYHILASSPAYGVDSFTKRFGSQFIFLQGHAEYDAGTLAREYRRDMSGYALRETSHRPPRPKGYFDAQAEEALDALERKAREAPGSVTADELGTIDALAPTEAPWRDHAVSFYRQWLKMIADTRRSAAAGSSRSAWDSERPRLDA